MKSRHDFEEIAGMHFAELHFCPICGGKLEMTRRGGDEEDVFLYFYAYFICENGPEMVAEWESDQAGPTITFFGNHDASTRTSF